MFVHLPKFAWSSAIRLGCRMTASSLVLLTGSSLAVTTAEVSIVGDTNRDGVIDAGDYSPGKQEWTWSAGALVMPNLDDDDRDGKADALDTRVNGPDDLKDLARFVVDVDGATQIVLEWGQAPIHVFADNGTDWNWDFVTAGKAIVLPAAKGGRLVLGVESYKLVGQDHWNGKADIKVTALDGDGKPVATDQVAIRATSWVMLPNSAKTEKFYFATGYYNNGAMASQLQSIVPSLDAEFPKPYSAHSWHEMWMQDTLEMGYLEIPGSRMHMVLNGLRGHDSFGPTLLGPDVGVFQIGSYRDLGSTGPDSWVDWMGNLEVSHPTPKYPLGRVYYGMNTTTGRHMQDAVIDFVKAQEVQPPFWVDTSWLIIKHVDELFNFIPGQDGRGVLYVVSPRAAAQVTGTSLDAANTSIQSSVDKMLHGGNYQVAGQGTVTNPGVLQQLGWDPNRVVDLPLLFTGATSAHNQWSNPVNSVYVNGDVIAGSSQMPVAIRNRIDELFRGQGVRRVQFVDDTPYQDNLGNVHCSSNTKRTPVVEAYWQAMGQ